MVYGFRNGFTVYSYKGGGLIVNKKKIKVTKPLRITICYLLKQNKAYMNNFKKMLRKEQKALFSKIFIGN